MANGGLPWGLKDDQDGFSIASLTLVGSSNVGNLRQACVFVLHIQYTKGDEDEMRVQIGLSLSRDDPEIFSRDSIVDLATGIVEPFEHVFQNSGSYRLAIPVAIQEDRMQITARRVGGSVGGAGSVLFTYGTDNQYSPPRC